MKKLLYSGIGIHAMVQLVSSLTIIPLSLISQNQVIYLINMMIAMALYLILMKKFSKAIVFKNLKREVRFILIMNTVLFAGGFLLFTNATGGLIKVGQIMIVAGVYFNNAFSPILSMNLPSVLAFIILGVVSPILLYSTYIMNVEKDDY